jgi:mono/diheme cytochrome c family protein
MVKLLMSFLKPDSQRSGAAGRGFLYGSVLASALMLGACAGDVGVKLENTQAAQEVARLSGPPGSVYIGWRVFQDKCAACHGPAASGTGAAPDLLPLVGQMGPRRFVGLVLSRYDWNLPPGQTGTGGEARERLIDDVMQRKEAAITMPAWEGNPSVSAHIADLYVYLSARAEGSQGTGRPLFN